MNVLSAQRPCSTAEPNTVGVGVPYQPSILRRLLTQNNNPRKYQPSILRRLLTQSNNPIIILCEKSPEYGELVFAWAAPLDQARVIIPACTLLTKGPSE